MRFSLKEYEPNLERSGILLILPLTDMLMVSFVLSFKENLILVSKTDGVENSDIVELLVKNGIKIQTVESYNNIEGYVALRLQP